MKPVAVALMSLVACAAVPATAQQSDAEVARQDYELAMTDQLERIEALEAQVARMTGVGSGADYGRGAGSFGPPRLMIRGFADVGYTAVEERPRTAVLPDESSRHFDTDGFSLILTSDISERVSFFSETQFGLTSSGATKVTIARMKLNVDVLDWMRFTAGKGHTPLGYWNKEYHHGAWVDPSVSRPLIYNYEGSGGILPLHYYGAELLGRIGVGLGDLSYVATLANSRGSTTTSTPIADLSSSKLLALMLTYQPSEGAGVGINLVANKIPADSSLGPLRDHTINERIGGAHLYYKAHAFDFMSEIQFIGHEDHGTGDRFSHYGGFAHLGYTIGKFTPYYRFDYLDIEDGDPFFVASGAVLARLSDTLQHTIGVRWDVLPYLAIKSEFRYLRDETQRDNIAAVQAAFTF